MDIRVAAFWVARQRYPGADRRSIVPLVLRHTSGFGSLHSMVDNPRRRWTEDELTLCMALYVRLRFGQFHQHNPDVIALSEQLGRTPGAIAMKLGNLASLDPRLRQKGLEGASATDRVIFDRYFGHWGQLVDDAAEIEARSILASPISIVPPAPTTIPEGPTERFAQVRQRLGQATFRGLVLNNFNGRCAVTGLEVDGLLRASHIVPWAADERRRVDPANGLLLNALHDAAFDRGLMTLDGEGRVIYGQSINSGFDTASMWMKQFAEKVVAGGVSFPLDRDALAYHRTQVFERR